MKKVVLALTAVIGFETTVSAQTTNGMGGGMIWLSIIVWIAVVWWYFHKKKQVKNNQVQLDEIFQEKGFSNTELILTEGTLSPTGNSTLRGVENPTDNILIGVKDGVLSFFGGGYTGKLTIKNDAVVLNARAEIMPVGKIIDISLYPKKDRKIRHLFDIPISDIAEITPYQKSKNVVVLDILEKSDKRTMLCFSYWKLKTLNTALANITMSAFEQILETGSISKGKISQINEKIQAACKAGNDEALKIMLKGIGTVVLVGGAVAGVTAAAVSRAGKDIGSSPKSTARYQSTETGNIYDEDGNRVPF